MKFLNHPMSTLIYACFTVSEICEKLKKYWPTDPQKIRAERATQTFFRRNGIISTELSSVEIYD